jgi:hypothetical protein
LYLFTSNNLFTVIFFFEVLSATTFLLLVTSNFSTIFTYKLTDFSNKNFFNLNFSKFYVNSLLYFFWISLIGSLFLFLFLTFFLINFFSFDFFFIEYVTLFILTSSTQATFVKGLIIWAGIVLTFFVKTGLAPFFFWKPVFFKGVSFYFIFFYTFVYYTGVLLFLTMFFIVYLNDLFIYFSSFMVILVTTSLFFFLTLLTEATYTKAFFAFSSILNTLLIFFTLTSFQGTAVFL